MNAIELNHVSNIVYVRWIQEVAVAHLPPSADIAEREIVPLAVRAADVVQVDRAQLISTVSRIRDHIQVWRLAERRTGPL